MRGSDSSGPGFSPEMIHNQLHTSQQGLVQAGLRGMGNPSDALRRAINAQLTSMSGYKEPLPQVFLLLHTFLHDFDDEIVMRHLILLHISELVTVSIWITTSIKNLHNLVTFVVCTQTEE